MDSLIFGLIALGCSLAGITCGMLLRLVLPLEHLSDESKDAVKLGTGMIATLGALVLGLLIASAKGNFDTVNGGLRDTGAKMILLDRTLARYGAETGEIRLLLRHYIRHAVIYNWPEDKARVTTTKTDYPENWASKDGIGDLQARLRALTPRNETERELKARAIQIGYEIDHARWLLFEQRGMTALPMTFLVIIVCWFTLLFISFGLLAPRNATVLVVLFVCALSVSCALFLMIELDHPYRGIVKAPSTPLVDALKFMGE